MNQLISFVKKLQLGRAIMAALAVVVLLVSTACNSGTVTGARPNNPPVQAGGANNPHKGGGDGYTNYKASEDPTANYHNQVNKKDRAELPSALDRLIAANVESDKSKLIYPGQGSTSTNEPNFGPVGSKGQDQLLQPQVPARRQPVIDRSDPNAKILEKSGEAFKDASSFLKDTTDSALRQPEMQANPALGD